MTEFNSCFARPIKRRPSKAMDCRSSLLSDADQTRAAVVCEPLLGRQGAQPFAEADDLGAIRVAFTRNQPITQTGSLIEPVAAIARMVAKAAGYQQVDLALDQLVQAGGAAAPTNRFPYARCETLPARGGAGRGCHERPIAAAPHLTVTIARSLPQCDQNHLKPRADRPDRPRSG